MEGALNKHRFCSPAGHDAERPMKNVVDLERSMQSLIYRRAGLLVLVGKFVIFPGREFKIISALC